MSPEVDSLIVTHAGGLDCSLLVFEVDAMTSLDILHPVCLPVMLELVQSSVAARLLVIIGGLE